MSGWVSAGVLSVGAGLIIAAPAHADPSQQCNTTFGQTASEQVQGYLDRHPDVKAEITARSQASGSGTDLIDYLNRHPDVRQALITLANQCTS
ncbi:hypothetical protein F0Q45_21510 [Mycobacterium simiae]|uniref:Hemophore-related protein n=1 Tax=Mycobacterium simiae TaxID=1784 RepID=A0A5B1BJL2_MYCSI|nr:hypothetical protein F0Q45_21510 [Mycobacterium simiae]